MRYLTQVGVSGVIICAATIQIHAQSKWSYPTCPDVNDTDFVVETLVQSHRDPDPNLSEPDKLAFDMDADGNVDVYFTEIRPGNIKRYNAKSKTVTTLITLPVWKGPYTAVNNGGRIEEGATGIALDPHFKDNGYLYVHWSPASAPVFRISRFTVKSDKIDPASEKIILDIEAQREDCCHTGGSLQFDAYGDLWIAQGANGGRPPSPLPTGTVQGMNESTKYLSEEWGASDTHSLRGGFLRIHPTPEGGYTIPADNFGEYFYKKTHNADYLDSTKVRPEVYIKGTRNNYSLALDPVRRWVLWGDVGPDRESVAAREEYNLRTSPGFEGWPYFVGDNFMFVGNKNPDAPTNTSKWNTGLKTLPAARPTFPLPDTFRKSKLGASPISGPLYLYDGDSKSKIKFPPHFNRKWFVTDHGSSAVYVFDIDSNGTQATGFQRIFANKSFSGPVDLRQGPDGALYITNYGNATFGTTAYTSIMKISYKGSCLPATPKLEAPGPSAIRFDMVPHRSGFLINLGSANLIKIPEGMSGIELYDIAGKQIWNTRNLKAGDSFHLPSGLRTGALKYRWIPASL